MKSFVRGLFACAWLATVVLFAGCRAPEPVPFTMDNPQPRVGAGSPSTPSTPSTPAHTSVTPPPNGAKVAVFRVGDTVNVTFSGSPVAIDPHQGTIKEDGTITLPLIGAIVAVGKTAGELQNEIYTNYVPKYYVRLTVNVRSGDRVIYVAGEVHGPGRVMYLGDTTVVKAIQSAGGLTDFASHSKIYLTHAGSTTRIQVNYDEALKNPAKDLPVYPDDQINVEKRIF